MATTPWTRRSESPDPSSRRWVDLGDQVGPDAQNRRAVTAEADGTRPEKNLDPTGSVKAAGQDRWGRSSRSNPTTTWRDRARWRWGPTFRRDVAGAVRGNLERTVGTLDGRVDTVSPEIPAPVVVPAPSTLKVREMEGR